MPPSTVLGALAYPITIVAAVLVFGLSTESALSLVAANASQFTTPVAVRGDFNLPPVRQLADLHPGRALRTTPARRPQPYSSFVSVAPPAESTDLALAAPAQSSITALAAPSGARIGRDAVNLRSGPSKSARVLGVVPAGAPVDVLGNEAGWVNVSANGKTGWVYTTYLIRSESVSITVSGGVAVAEQ